MGQTKKGLQWIYSAGTRCQQEECVPWVTAPGRVTCSTGRRLQDTQRDPWFRGAVLSFTGVYASLTRRRKLPEGGSREAAPAALLPTLHTHLSISSLWVLMSTPTDFPRSRNNRKKNIFKRCSLMISCSHVCRDTIPSVESLFIATPGI